MSRRIAFFVVAALGLFGAACEEDTEILPDPTTSSSSTGGSTPVPCDEDPYSCPMGTTCWAVSNGFDCVPSGPGAEGANCQPFLADATCGDGLICIKLMEPSGTCVPFCTEDLPCDPGVECKALQFDSAHTITACEP
jgi:hypothetical protein